jgi:hypothetical protein
MAIITPTRIKHGWQVVQGDLTLDAENPHFDRGAIRAALTVRNCTAIYYRDTANLTSARSRARIVQALAKQDVHLSEEALIALDEACRQRPAPSPAKTMRRDGEGDFSEKVTQLSDLQARITSFLLLNDPDLLPVLLGAMASHCFQGTPVWLLIVAPPSGTKTELIVALANVPQVYFLSEVTAHTFASGLNPPGEDPSLLARLTNEVLLLKDFTSLLELPHDERQGILAQLREIYDGKYTKKWGTGKRLDWEGRLGFLAGVTPIIDSYHSVMNMLGERFLLLRVLQPDRQEMAKKALKNATKEGEMRRTLRALMHGFLTSLPDEPPSVPATLCEQLATIADFVTRCRSGVVRDGYRRELEYAPEPEMPARLAKQLFELLRGVALVCGHQEATQEDYDRIARVALDCIPAARRTVLRTIATLRAMEAGALTTAKVAQTAQYSTAAVRRALEDLQALGILHVTKGGQSVADKWQPRQEWHAALDTLKKVESAVETRRKTTFSEKSEEGRTHNSEDATPNGGNEEVF